VNLFFPSSPALPDRRQSRLMILATAFVFLFAIILTVSPAVRLHAWDVPYRWQHWIGFFAWLAGFAYLHRLSQRLLPNRDPYLLPIAALLSGWGLLTIWRLDMVYGLRQTAWLVVSMGALAVGMHSQRLLGFLRRYKYIWLTGGLLLALATFFFGTFPGGTGPRLWLGCCGFYLQPSEPLKLLLIIYLAAYLADRLPLGFSFWQLLAPTLVVVGAALAILIAQQDLGTASIFLILYFVVIYLGTGRRTVLVIAFVLLLAGVVTGYMLFDVIRLRMDAWLNPWLDPSGRSYQIVQSIMAVAAGGILGSGPGLGSPGVVPVAISDFIFSAIAEETGLMGAIALLGILAMFAARGMMTALRSANLFQRLLAGGLTAYLAAQSILILGGNLRLLPLTGVTLPFVSYGGSSLLTATCSLLLLLKISNHTDLEPARLENPRPFFVITGGIFAAFTALALLASWWAFPRAADLLARYDNPRWSITDRYSPRGNLLDRHNEPIAVTAGQPGDFYRHLTQPQLGPVVGYTHPLYGQTGLEAGVDGYLRGLLGVPASSIWLNQVLYAQRPPGLDVRLSLDLHQQTLADELLEGHKGAAVVMNASNGEILVMASHPGYDPEQIEQQWETWVESEDAPLLNRATQGQYPPGAAMAPFLLAWSGKAGNPPDLPDVPTIQYEDATWDCAGFIEGDASWRQLVAKGCPAGNLTLANGMSITAITRMYQELGFGLAPELPLEVAPAAEIGRKMDKKEAALGQADVLVSPLQMARAAAILTSNGSRPVPQMALAVNTPTQGWVALPRSNSETVISQADFSTTTHLLANNPLPFWYVIASAHTPEGIITWFVGGTLEEWQGTPLSIAVVIEENNPYAAQRIGIDLLQSSFQTE